MPAAKSRSELMPAAHRSCRRQISCAQQRYDRACYNEQHCFESGHHPTLEFLGPEKAMTGTTTTQARAYARLSGAVRGRSRVFDRIESSLRSKCLHLCGETPPDQRSSARVKAAGSEKLRAAEICASGSSVSDTSRPATWQVCLRAGGYGSEDGARYCPEAH
jgi:hypothetical protein